MATLTIRNLPDHVRDGLRVRAARKGRSMEAEAREVLAAAARETDDAPRQDFENKVRQMQDRFRELIKPGVSLVDELIADRRWEAACERAEIEGRPKPPRSDFDADG